MTWFWRQRQGALWHGDNHIADGYSGAPEARNDPAREQESNVGPLPRGIYRIGSPRDLQGGEHGPFVLPLTACGSDPTFGRGGFLIHGDSKTAPGTASHGCIILPRDIRERIAASNDLFLVVVSGDDQRAPGAG